MLKRTLTIITILSLCLLLLLLTTTTPATAGPFGLLVIFITAYLASLGLMSFFLYGMGRVITFVTRGFTIKKPLKPLSLRHSYYYSTVIAAAPIMLVGLQSIGSIGIYEVALVIIFVVIGCVYITKRI